jgi:hypothetical protein
MNITNDKSTLFYELVEELKNDAEYRKDLSEAIAYRKDISEDIADVLANPQPLSEFRGLCCTVFCYISCGVLEAIFSTWPKFSGDLRYPVPSTLEGNPNPETAYQVARKNGTMLEGEYGTMRKELYEHTLVGLKTLKWIIGKIDSGEPLPE